MGTPLHIANHAFFPKADVNDAPIKLSGVVDLSQCYSDYNAFYQTDPNKPVVRWLNRPDGLPALLTLTEWQALGMDLHSKVYDPLDPEVAANIALYHSRDATAVPPLIQAPCCARFLFVLGTFSGDPSSDPSQAVFSQHMASGIGPSGWSDVVAYPEFGYASATFCGPCNRDGLLADYP